MKKLLVLSLFLVSAFSLSGVSRQFVRRNCIKMAHNEGLETKSASWKQFVKNCVKNPGKAAILPGGPRIR